MYLFLLKHLNSYTNLKRNNHYTFRLFLIMRGALTTTLKNSEYVLHYVKEKVRLAFAGIGERSQTPWWAGKFGGGGGQKKF